jgi:hypothetical protein
MTLAVRRGRYTCARRQSGGHASSRFSRVRVRPRARFTPLGRFMRRGNMHAAALTCSDDRTGGPSSQTLALTKSNERETCLVRGKWQRKVYLHPLRRLFLFEVYSERSPSSYPLRSPARPSTCASTRGATRSRHRPRGAGAVAAGAREGGTGVPPFFSQIQYNCQSHRACGRVAGTICSGPSHLFR